MKRCRSCRREHNEQLRTCSSCRAQQKEYYQQHRDRVAKRQAGWYRRLKQEMFEAYGGPRCVCCGITGEVFLAFDHINNDGNQHRLEIMGHRTATGTGFYSKMKQAGFPPILQVLCHNCNTAKHINGGSCVHGEEPGYLSSLVGLLA